MRKVDISYCEYVPGQIVISKAGHDRGHIYVVTRAGADGVWLADGRIRTLERPKFKKQKHIQKTLTIVPELSGGDPASAWTDVNVSKAIKAYASKL